MDYREELGTRNRQQTESRTHSHQNNLGDVVYEQLLADPLCLNLKNGGVGGWKLTAEQELRRISSLSRSLVGRKLSSTQREAIAKGVRGNKKCAPSNSPRFAGKKHSEETLAKMRASHSGKQVGKKNSQFGSCWVTDGTQAFKIKKEQLENFLLNGYLRGRKFAQV